MIAARQLTLVADNGQVREVLVRIGKPEFSPDRCDYSCQLILRLISIMLNHYRQEANGAICWLEPGDDMGFAVAEQPRF